MLGISDAYAHEQIDPACPVDWSHSLNVGRIAWWLDTGTPGWRGGNTLRDLVRGGGHSPNDGTLSGATKPAWGGAKGRLGGRGSLLFDGTSSRVDVLDSTRFDIPTCTVACWVKMTSTATGILVERWNSGVNPLRYPFGLRVNQTAGKASFHAFDGTNNPIATSAATITDGLWHHVVGVRVAGATLKIYVDGVLSGTVADTTTPASTVPGAGIGIGSRSSGAVFFNGSVDDVGVWNRALSAQGVASLYALSRQGYPGVLRRVGTRESWPTTGVSGITGASAVTLDGVTLTSASVNPVVGSALNTFEALTPSSAGSVVVAGASSNVLGALTVSSTSSTVVGGVASVLLGNVSLTSAGLDNLFASSSITLGPLTLAGVGADVVVGSSAASLGNVTLVSAGSVPDAGSSSVPLAPLSLSSVGVVPVTGSASALLGDVTLTSTVGAFTITGSVGVILGSLGSSSTGSVVVAGSSTIPLGGVGISSTAMTVLTGSLSATLQGLGAVSAGLVPVVGSGSMTLGSVRIACAGNAGVTPLSMTVRDVLDLVYAVSDPINLPFAVTDAVGFLEYRS